MFDRQFFDAVKIFFGAKMAQPPNPLKKLDHMPVGGCTLIIDQF